MDYLSKAAPNRGSLRSDVGQGQASLQQKVIDELFYHEKQKKKKEIMLVARPG